MTRSKIPGKPPRLQDVAELAGVSLGAASRILRGDCAKFSEGTSERVAAAAATLGCTSAVTSSATLPLR